MEARDRVYAQPVLGELRSDARDEADRLERGLHAEGDHAARVLEFQAGFLCIC